MSPLLVYEKGVVKKASLRDLREAVYILVSSIPPGRVATYKCISEIIGVSPRLVAWFLKTNDKPVVIPCHRVVYSDLRVGGYSRGGWRVKERLLRLEGVEVRGGRVLEEYLVDECRAKHLYSPSRS